MGQSDFGGDRTGAARGVMVFVWLALGCQNPSEPPPAAAGGAGAAVGGGSSVNAGGAPRDAEELWAAQARGYCARLFRCFEADDNFMVARLLLKTTEGCEAEVRKINMQSPGRRDLQAQLAAGTLQYDPAAAEKCLTELSTCNGIDALSAGSCREVYEGSAQKGEACQRSEDCAGDAYCEREAFRCPGQCLPRKASGEECESNYECSHALGSAWCDQEAVPAVCRSQRLGVKANLGDPCTRRPRAHERVVCTDDLWCGHDPQLGPSAEQGRCLEPLQLGDPCNDSDDVCLGGLCDATAGVCMKPIIRSKAGEPCGESEAGKCDPTLSLRCNAQGTCDAAGDGSAGSVCFGGDFQRGCDSGLYCSTEGTEPTASCKPWRAAGASCEHDNECASGACEATCQPRFCGP